MESDIFYGERYLAEKFCQITQYHEVTSSVVVVEDVVQAKARGVGTKSEIYNQEGGVY